MPSSISCYVMLGGDVMPRAEYAVQHYIATPLQEQEQQQDQQQPPPQQQQRHLDTQQALPAGRPSCRLQLSGRALKYMESWG